MDVVSSFFSASNWISWSLFYELNVSFEVNINIEGDLKKIKKLQELNYLLIKVMLFYYWNTLKLVDQLDSFLNGLIVGHAYTANKIFSFEFYYDVTADNVYKFKGKGDRVVDYCRVEGIELDNKIGNFFINMRSKLIGECKIESKGLTKLNYYEKNFKHLNELNEFIKKEVNRLNNSI